MSRNIKHETILIRIHSEAKQYGYQMFQVKIPHCRIGKFGNGDLKCCRQLLRPDTNQATCSPDKWSSGGSSVYSRMTQMTQSFPQTAIISTLKCNKNNLFSEICSTVTHFYVLQCHYLPRHCCSLGENLLVLRQRPWQTSRFPCHITLLKETSYLLSTL